MEKFFELFKKNLKTERLELRIMEPTLENAKIVWNVVKNENPDDFEFIFYSKNYTKHLPESEQDTLETMKQENKNTANNEGVLFGIYKDDNLIGRNIFHNTFQ